MDQIERRRIDHEKYAEQTRLAAECLKAADQFRELAFDVAPDYERFGAYANEYAEAVRARYEAHIAFFVHRAYKHQVYADDYAAHLGIAS
jgi:hypothetical protein